MNGRVAAGLLTVLALIATAGCGDDDSDSSVPADAVARVDDTLITKQRARTFLRATAQPEKQLRQVSRYLIVAEWIRQEAKRREIAVPKNELGDAGAKTLALELGRVQSLTNAIVEQAGGGPPPEAEIARYYREHPREYALPEVRYMRSVAAGSRAQASAAKRALEQGESWKAVIDRYSTRKGSPTPPSGDMGLQPGEFAEPLGNAVYAARRGTFYGPVKTDEAWYVFELTVIDRLPRQSLEQVRKTLSIRLQAKRREHAVQVVRRQLRDRYRPITVCNEELLLAECRNGPPLELDAAWPVGL